MLPQNGLLLLLLFLPSSAGSAHGGPAQSTCDATHRDCTHNRDCNQDPGCSEWQCFPGILPHPGSCAGPPPPPPPAPPTHCAGFCKSDADCRSHGPGCGAWQCSSLLAKCISTSAAAQNHVKTVIATKDAPAAIGPYSQAILVRPPGQTEGGMAYVAGQIGLFPNGTVAPGGIKAEAQQAMSNIRAILKAASLVMDDIVECSCLLADLDEYADFNSVYATFFAEAPPARAAFQVVRLPKDVRCEVKCTALA